MCAYGTDRRFNRIVKGVEEEEYIIISGRENCPERIGPEGRTPG